MSSTSDLSPAALQKMRHTPMHAVLLHLGRSAIDRNMHQTVEFRKLIAYLLEVADGRDRREPCTSKPGVARPVPRVRILLEQCFGQYAELEWFKVTKITNASGMPLKGLFRFVAAGISRVSPEDFAEIIKALCAANADAAVLRMLQRRGGKIKGVGLELFSRLAFAFRRDLYFVIPKEWGETSGCLRFIDGGLRRYCAFCRSLRGVCDDLGVDVEIRGSVMDRALRAEEPSRRLLAAIGDVMGPSLARFAVLEPADAYVATEKKDDLAARPLEFAAENIRARRGERRLRAKLLRAGGNCCAISGSCPIDLLEVAYVVPFPSGQLHSPDNALLLRADLHTLWDLNLIAIDPETMTIRISPRLHGSMYERLMGQKIGPRADGSKVGPGAIRQRWDVFIAKSSKKKDKDSTTSVAPGRGESSSPTGAEERLSSSGSFAGFPMN